MPATFTTITLAEGIDQYGLTDIGVIVDISGSVPQAELKQVALSIEEAPRGCIAGIALTDTKVQHVGTREEITDKLKFGRVNGGGTDFAAVVDDAWKAMGSPTSLALISDGESPRWPNRFPVPTVLFLIGRPDHGSFSGFTGYVTRLLPAIDASTNVTHIVQIELPHLQDLSRGLD